MLELYFGDRDHSFRLSTPIFQWLVARRPVNLPAKHLNSSSLTQSQQIKSIILRIVEVILKSKCSVKFHLLWKKTCKLVQSYVVLYSNSVGYCCLSCGCYWGVPVETNLLLVNHVNNRRPKTMVTFLFDLLQ